MEIDRNAFSDYREGVEEGKVEQGGTGSIGYCLASV